ncbi:hypothetical protein MED01_002383 [Micromonospora sp. MED01]|uniref:hypothetical protein n=1 Tax=Micromonospora alfalfae TaxID=2911212 RepID=UPI001EE8E13C|nr:hypothetical protein [Micromonospora alfalfae]MCG5464218.1 hypothetical protein [Micromonospora alfalfae]
MPNRPTPARVTTDVPGYSRVAFDAALHSRRPAAESAPTIEAPTERVIVREADPSGATVTRPGRLAIRLIRAGWSLNSNYYPAEVLRRDGPAAWPAGTQCMADHATEDEEAARPSGSVRAVAAVQTSDARWDEGEQALMAEVRLLHPWRDTITDMARAQAEEGVDVIGMSIRAWVTGEHGEREGREGFIVQSIPEGRSVDFVTKPAAGGGIVSVLESVGNTVPVAEARNVAHWFEARLHRDFTERADDMFGDGRLTRDERITLSGAVGDALSAFAARIEADAPQLLARDLWEEPPQPQTAPAAEAAPDSGPADTPPPPTPEAVPAAPNSVTDGAPPTAPNPPIEKEPAMSGTTTGTAPVEAGTAPVVDTAPVTAPAAESAPHAQTTAALEAVTAQLAQMQQQLTAVQVANTARESENRSLRNRERASEAVTVALRAPEHADVVAQISPRVTSRVLGQVPTTAEGVVDETALTAAITTAIADEAAYVRGARAEALEAAGVGQPYGLGAAVQESPKDDGFRKELDSFFSDTLGLTAEAASIAAKGRN